LRSREFGLAPGGEASDNIADLGEAEIGEGGGCEDG